MLSVLLLPLFGSRLVWRNWFSSRPDVETRLGIKQDFFFFFRGEEIEIEELHLSAWTLAEWRSLRFEAWGS